MFGKDRLKLMDMNFIQQETDLIVHRKLGLILVETKSVKKFTSKMYATAKQELDRAEAQLVTNRYFELTMDAKRVVKKVIACPLLEGKPLQPDRRIADMKYIDLHMNHLSNFDEWWKVMIESKQPCLDPSYTELCSTIYYNLVPKLLCGRGDICICLNIAETAIKLDSQGSLGELAKRENQSNSDVIKVSCTSEVISDVNILTRKWLYLTPEQCETWKKQKQVICGPYGCGKTLLLQCKAATLACSGQSVLVIVPSHLKAGYKKFFEENVSVENSKLQLISGGDFYKSFDYYKTIAQSSHVFVDELLWPYVEESDSSEESMSTSNSDCEGLSNLKDWTMEEESCETTHTTSNGTKSGGPHNLELSKPKNLDDSISQNSSLSVSENTIDELHSHEQLLSQNTISERESDSLEQSTDECILSNVEQRMSHSSDYASSRNSLEIQSSYNDEISVQFLNFIQTLLMAKDNSYSVWLVPHLYVIIRHILFYNDIQSGEVAQFIKMFDSLPVSRLTTIMRTSKQIHDYKIQKEWEGFCHNCNDDDEEEVMLERYLNHKFFRMVFQSFLGHSISGPPVKMITYPTHCHNYNVRAKLPNEKNCSPLSSFCC